MREIHVRLDSKTQPLTKLLPGDELMLAASEQLGLFVDFFGAAIQKNPISWEHAPQAVGEDRHSREHANMLV